MLIECLGPPPDGNPAEGLTLQREGTAMRATKKFKLSIREAPQLYDALFIGLDGGALGEVVAKASPAGRRAIEKLFPNARIAWRELDAAERPYLPQDWREFTFVVPWLLQHAPDHKLCLDLLALKPIDQFSPDDFAFLLLISTREQGVRVALYSDAEHGFVEFPAPSQHN
jgi:hypothetical protein